MGLHLLLTVHLHGDGQGSTRYHGMHQGASEWPPSPARIFQALVAGVARGNLLPEDTIPAFKWFERLDPPLIGAPVRTLGQRFSLFVPNNDADSLSNPLDVSEIRVKKVVHPSLFPESSALLYVWSLPEANDLASQIVAAADQLYQLGRGVDIAWARAEIVDDEELGRRLDAYTGVLHRPESGGRSGPMLACPVGGSLESLIARHHAVKLRTESTGKGRRTLFMNPPKPLFVSVGYGRYRRQAVYELRDRMTGKPWPWRLDRAVKLVENLRDQAVARLKAGLPDQFDQIERVIVGRRPDGEPAVPIAQRVRIIPLPSIGSQYADHGIRRILVEVPSGCPLHAADVEWAFSGVEDEAATADASGPFVVVRCEDAPMLRHYVRPSRHWRSVTPVALPEVAGRRRIDPARRQEEAKGAQERIEEELRAIGAVLQALRHAEVRARVLNVRVQREPFEAHGARAEAFVEGTRFAKERLWHVALEFDRAIEGPLVIGDGRFLGLGLLAPASDVWQRNGVGDHRPAGSSQPLGEGLFVFSVAGQVKDEPILLARALRSAVMGRVQAVIGPTQLDSFFSGHYDTEPGKRLFRSNHLAFQWDPSGRRLLIIAPHMLDRRHPSGYERRNIGILHEALEGFSELRAGVAGRFGLVRVALEENDPLVRYAKSWVSLTPYVVTRHVRQGSAAEVLTVDILKECHRSGLPRPQVTVLDVRGVPGVGLQGRVRLDFAVPVVGPIALGRTRYLGGGLFRNETSSSSVIEPQCHPDL